MPALLPIADAYRLCRASQAAYGDAAGFAVEFAMAVQPFTTGRLAGLFAWNEADVLVAFRGTVLAERDADPDDWRAMFSTMFCNIAFAQTDSCESRVHRGFLAALDSGWDYVANRVAVLQAPGRRLLLAGHSQGGALATLAGWHWHDIKAEVAAVCTFGSPRVGNADFARRYPVPLDRFENKNDIVPHLPPPPRLAQQLKGVLGDWVRNNVDYEHVGRLRYVTSAGELYDEPGRMEQYLRIGRLIAEGWRRPRQLLRDHAMTAYVEALKNLAGR